MFKLWRGMGVNVQSPTRATSSRSCTFILIPSTSGRRTTWSGGGCVCFGLPKRCRHGESNDGTKRDRDLSKFDMSHEPLPWLLGKDALKRDGGIWGCPRLSAHIQQQEELAKYGKRYNYIIPGIIVAGQLWELCAESVLRWARGKGRIRNKLSLTPRRTRPGQQSDWAMWWLSRMRCHFRYIGPSIIANISIKVSWAVLRLYSNPYTNMWHDLD